MVEVLKNIMTQHTTPINPDIGNGLAVPVVETAMEHLDLLIRNTMRSAPEPFEYLGYKMVSPEDEYASIQKARKFDFSRSDLHKHTLHFAWDGVPLQVRPLYIPFMVDKSLHLSGTKYQVMPVLSDSVITPEANTIFLKMNKDKNILFQNNINYYCNGDIENGRVVFSFIYRARVVKDILGKSIVPPIVLYILGKYGLKESMKKFANGEITFSNSSLEDLKNACPDHNIYSSYGKKPRTLSTTTYKPHTWKILIRKDVCNGFTEALIGGLMYVFDVFPDKIQEMIAIFYEDDVEEEISAWRFILGTLIFKGGKPAMTVGDDMDKHFKTLGPYVDDIIKERLKERNIFVDNFFELLGVVLQDFSKLILNYKTYSNNMVNRYVDINYYLLYDIVNMIHTALFEIGKKDNLTYEEVNKIINEGITSKAFYKVIKGGAMNLTLALTEVSGSNLLTRASTLVALQEDGKGVNRVKKVSKIPAPFLILTASQLHTGSMLGLKKPKPIPVATLNYFLKINMNTGKILVTDEEQDTMDKLNKLFTLKDINQTQAIVNDDGSESISLK